MRAGAKTAAENPFGFGQCINSNVSLYKETR